MEEVEVERERERESERSEIKLLTTFSFFFFGRQVRSFPARLCASSLLFHEAAALSLWPLWPPWCLRSLRKATTTATKRRRIENGGDGGAGRRSFRPIAPLSFLLSCSLSARACHSTSNVFKSLCCLRNSCEEEEANEREQSGEEERARPSSSIDDDLDDDFFSLCPTPLRQPGPLVAGIFRPVCDLRMRSLVSREGVESDRNGRRRVGIRDPAQRAAGERASGGGGCFLSIDAANHSAVAGLLPLVAWFLF